MNNIYLWAKLFHILFVVAWMAGLLYLPRIFVYHAGENVSSNTSDIFKVMEKRLYYYIAYPSAVLVWITGLFMAFKLGLYLWLVLKFSLVIILTLYHINLGRFVQDFAGNQNKKKSKYFRLINEIPFIILFGILIFVVLKPYSYLI
jgi:putative membrane protein|tara:strand:- start:1616 stop:2053 length:438 start_codon:yes stop_codon:yes gene_type:complete